jgi:hypothetical protein
MRIKRFYIAVNPIGSKFAKALQGELKEVVPTIKTRRVDHRKGETKEGYGHPVFYVTPRTLNKIEQLTRFKANNVSCPNFVTSVRDLDQLGTEHIFARTLTNSTGGRGIVEFDRANGGNIPNAPLYTAYIPKKAEYRAHVFAGTVIDVQQKKKRRGFSEDRNTRIRNLANGYVYTRDGVVPPDGMGDLAIAAVRAVGYMYGAVDIVYNERQNQCYVLEVNSRPGLMGTTLDRYVSALCTHFDLRN